MVVIIFIYFLNHFSLSQDSAPKSRSVTTVTPPRGSNVVLPPLPAAPVFPRLPPEAERTSPPQQPQLKLVPSQSGIVLSWCVSETDRTCAAVESYHLYAFHQDNSNNNTTQQHWKKIGEVKALPLPMACTLTQFQSGSTYHFAVRAKDVYGRFGSFCEPQCTNVISSSSSWTAEKWKQFCSSTFDFLYFLCQEFEYCALNIYSICKFLCITTGLTWRFGDMANGWLCLVIVCSVFFVT